MYNDLFQRINQGEVLSKKELEILITPDAEIIVEQPFQDIKSEALESLHAVMRYLQGKGYKIKKSAIYNHKTAGKIRPNKEGKYLLTDVEKYAQAHLQRSDGSPSPGQVLDKAQKERAEAETRERTARARHWELRTGSLENKLVPRELFENEIAGRAAIFRTDGENFFRGQAPAMVNIVNGDETKIPELIDFCLNALEQWLARYLQKEEFKVDATAYEKIFKRASAGDIDDIDDSGKTTDLESSGTFEGNDT